MQDWNLCGTVTCAGMLLTQEKLQLLFSSHPKPLDRIKKIERVYDKSAITSGKLVETRFISAMNQVSR